MSRRIETDTPIETNRFHADVFWMAKEPLQLDTPYTIRLGTQELKGHVVAINQIMDSSTLEHHDRSATRSGAQ